MLLKHEIEQLKKDNHFVASAGIHYFPDSPPDPKMVEYLLQNNVSFKNHSSRQIQEKDILWADHIFVMEKNHAMEIIKTWPDSTDKVELLGKYISADQSDDDVIDPFGRSPYHYRLAQAQIALAIKNIVQILL